MERNGKAWVGETEASRMLGLGVGVIRSMGKTGRVKVRTTPGAKAMRKYSSEDLGKVAEAMEAGPAIEEDKPINLNGRVPDWTNQTFIGRMDSCWMYMTAHGILDAGESRSARRKLEELAARAGPNGKWRAVDAPSGSRSQAGEMEWREIEAERGT